jgi:hypothetical protein
MLGILFLIRRNIKKTEAFGFSLKLVYSSAEEP